MMIWKSLAMLFVLLFSTIAVTLVKSTKCGREISSTGSDFMVGVLGTNGYPVNLDLYITTDGHADVHIMAPYVNLDEHVNVYQFMSYTLNETLVQLTNGTESKGLIIHSNASISVFVTTNGNADNIEGFLALPITALGTSYVATSYHPYSTFYSEFLVIGVEATTNVTIKLPLAYHKITFTKQLQKYESYQFQGPYDISGTIIKSDKPVAVISGSSGSKIPVGHGDWQILTEQMIPTNMWSYEYVVPSIYPMGYVIKIFARDNNTEVNYRNSSHNANAFIDEAESVELQFGQESTIVTANRPIYVVQYGYDMERSFGDPFMMNVQAVTQYQRSYTFRTQSFNSGGYNTLAITVHKSDISGLLLNNGHNVFSSAISKTVAPPMDGYINVFLNVSYNTNYTLTHSSNKTFGAVIFGSFDIHSAYGYMLKSTFTDITDCIVGITTTTTTTTTTSTTKDNTKQPFSTTGHGQNGSNKTRCFSCDEMTSLKYCDTVDVCGEKEVCYIQSAITNTHVKHFRSGCTADLKCHFNGQKRSNSGNCFECCHGDYCNSHGCGDDGILSLDSRGPICFDCRHISTQQSCQQVRICADNQICIIEKYEWAGVEHYFSMGCSDNRQCSSDKRSVDNWDQHKDVRNIPVCVSCCSGDFCNDNCTTTADHGFAIVG